MLIEVTDEVEVGHYEYCGGSTKITVKLSVANDNAIEQRVKYDILDCIDTLDHSMIIASEEAKKFYQRYYIVDTNLRYSFYNQVAAILYQRLPKEAKESLEEISVEWDKIRCTYNKDDLDVNYIKEMFQCQY